MGNHLVESADLNIEIDFLSLTTNCVSTLHMTSTGKSQSFNVDNDNIESIINLSNEIEDIL